MFRETPRHFGLVVVKSVHTAISLLVEVADGHLLFTGLTNRSDRRAGVAAAVVAAEGII